MLKKLNNWIKLERKEGFLVFLVERLTKQTGRDRRIERKYSSNSYR